MSTESRDFDIVLGTLVKCNIASEQITIPPEVTAIGPMAFVNNADLKVLNMGYGLKKIGMNAFKGCIQLRDLVIPDTVTVIGSGAFKGCTDLKSVKLGNRLVKIGDSAFSDCIGIESIEIPLSVNVLGKYAFANCSNLKNIKLNNKMKKIDEGCFKGCTSIESINLPRVLKKLGKNAFLRCTSLQSIETPIGLKCIRSGTFADCEALTEATIKDSHTVVESGAFSNTPNLKSFVSGFTKFNVGFDDITDNKEQHFNNLINLSSIAERPQDYTIADIAYLMSFGGTSILNNLSPYIKELVEDLVAFKEHNPDFEFNLDLAKDENDSEEEPSEKKTKLLNQHFASGHYKNESLVPKDYGTKILEGIIKVLNLDDEEDDYDTEEEEQEVIERRKSNESDVADRKRRKLVDDEDFSELEPEPKKKRRKIDDELNNLDSNESPKPLPELRFVGSDNIPSKPLTEEEIDLFNQLHGKSKQPEVPEFVMPTTRENSMGVHVQRKNEESSSFVDIPIPQRKVARPRPRQLDETDTTSIFGQDIIEQPVLPEIQRPRRKRHTDKEEQESLFDSDKKINNI